MKKANWFLILSAFALSKAHKWASDSTDGTLFGLHSNIYFAATCILLLVIIFKIIMEFRRTGYLKYEAAESLSTLILLIITCLGVIFMMLHKAFKKESVQTVIVAFQCSVIILLYLIGGIKYYRSQQLALRERKGQ